MNKYLIAVVGHHRGGTSAAAGALVKLGLYPGPEENLMPPSDDNPKGYFEYLPIVNMHDRLLLALDRNWQDNRPLPDGWAKGVPYAQARKALRGFIRRLTEEADGAPVVVKDPRIARFLPLYRDVCWAEGITLRALVVDRSLQSVSASIRERDGWDEARAWEFVCQQESYLRAWLTLGTSISFPNFLEDPELRLVGAVRRLIPGELCYDPRMLNAFLDVGLVTHG